MLCYKCKKQLRENANFCSKCGSKVKTYDELKQEIINKYEQMRNIHVDERTNKLIANDLLNLEYKEIHEKTFLLSEKEMDGKCYSRAINQDNIFNIYSDEFTKICEEYLLYLPKLVEYDRKFYKINGYGNINRCHGMIKNYIILLGKQENYERQSEVIGFLLGLGITDDGTKGGLKARMKNCEENLMKSRTKDKWFKDHQ